MSRSAFQIGSFCWFGLSEISALTYAFRTYTSASSWVMRLSVSVSTAVSIPRPVRGRHEATP